MKANESSITSLVSAFARAYHSRYDEPKIFDDKLATKLITSSEFSAISSSMINGISFFNAELARTHKNHPDELLRWITQVQLSSTPLSRAAFCEDVLMNELRLGIEQYVILGAGMDTFCFRHPELEGTLAIYEIDHPSTQLFKQKRLEEAGFVIPSHLHFVPMDFSQQLRLDDLYRAGFSHRKTFCSLLGVSYYITKHELASLLQLLFSQLPSGSSIVLDLADEHLFTEKGRHNRVDNMLKMAAAGGEAMKSCYTYAEIEALLEEAGLLIYEHLTPSMIQERYFGSRADDLSAFETIHYIHAIKR